MSIDRPKPPPKDFRPNLFYVHILNCVDGDTVDIEFDLRLGSRRQERLRFNRIDAWEKTGEEKNLGIIALKALTKLLEDKIVIVETLKNTRDKDRKGKYGRYLVEVWVQNDDLSFINVNDWLVEHGHAIYKNY